MEKDLTKQNYIGRVIYNQDPDFSGRCKVRVFGLMDDEETMPDAVIPWFAPVSGTVFSGNSEDGMGCGNISIPKVGALVRVRFANGDLLSGEYCAIQNIDPNLINYIKDDYLGTHVICYDSEKDLAILFQPSSGLKIYYQGSFIQITPDSMITIAHDSASSVIQLKDDEITITANSKISITGANQVDLNASNVNINGGNVNVGDGANQPAVLGNELVKVLRNLSSQIALKYPQTPATPDTFTINSILSNNVKVK